MLFSKSVKRLVEDVCGGFGVVESKAWRAKTNYSVTTAYSVQRTAYRVRSRRNQLTRQLH
jgi:hypothetical protein